MRDDRLTSAEAAERLGISREAVYVLNSRKGNGFPQPVYVGRTPMWTSAELDTWRTAHPSKRPVERGEEDRKARKRSAAQQPHLLRAHLAFATVRRHPVLTPYLQSLAEYAMHTAAQELDAEIEQLRGQADLLQVTVRYPAHVSIASLAKRFRGAVSRAIRQSLDINGNIWSKPYYAASIDSHSPAGLSQYVEHLEQPVNN